MKQLSALKALASLCERNEAEAGNELGIYRPLTVVDMIKETQTGPSTSYREMRLLLSLAVVLLGLPGISSAFTCPRMTPAEVQSKSCSHCPDEKPEKTECLLICPYPVERTAVLNAEGLTDTVTLPAQLLAGLLHCPSDAAVSAVLLPKDFDSGPLYLLNRVLLI